MLPKMCTACNVLYVKILALKRNLSKNWEMLWSLAFVVTTELSHGLYKILYSSILRSCLGSCVSVPCYVHSVSLLYVYLLISVYQSSLALRPLGCHRSTLQTM